MKTITVTIPARDLAQRITELELTVEALKNSINNLLTRIAALENP
jgi:hypothetical protein